jgi:hypothetical protein
MVSVVMSPNDIRKHVPCIAGGGEVAIASKSWRWAASAMASRHFMDNVVDYPSVVAPLVEQELAAKIRHCDSPLRCKGAPANETATTPALDGQIALSVATAEPDVGELGVGAITVPGAGLVFIFRMGAVMSTAGCSDQRCPPPWLSDDLFGVLFYGAPVVAVLAVAISFYTATRKRGILVPLCAWDILGRRRGHPRTHV